HTHFDCDWSSDVCPSDLPTSARECRCRSPRVPRSPRSWITTTTAGSTSSQSGPISAHTCCTMWRDGGLKTSRERPAWTTSQAHRSEEHTSELQSQSNLVC